MKPKRILQSYLLGLWALLGYWVATVPGLTGENGWAFQQNIVVQTLVLTAYYGTWFLIFMFAWCKITGD